MPPLVLKSRPRTEGPIAEFLRVPEVTPEVAALRYGLARKEHIKKARFIAKIAVPIVIASIAVWNMARKPELNFGATSQIQSIIKAESYESARNFPMAAETYKKLAAESESDMDRAQLFGDQKASEKAETDSKYFKKKQQEDEQKK